jgi:prepilin-type N-terminal cleavage/methylation domain-containing protein
MKSSPRAFTFVELLIAILIVAILSIALLTNFQRSRLKANFEDQVTNIVRIMEEVRAYSRTGILVNGTDPANYYLLTIGSGELTIDIFSDTSHETISEYELDAGFETNGADREIYFFPPNGEICFSKYCTDSTTEYTFTVQDTSGTYTQDITINIYGGYPELD